MKILRQLIGLHKFIFVGALIITFCSVFMSLYWNNFLADLLDGLRDASLFVMTSGGISFSQILLHALLIMILLTVSEYGSSFLAAYTCELFAHEMRMGYARFYLKCNVQTLSKLNAGEEQSAMQNELSEVSSYLSGNLFPFMKQLISFVFTVVFLLCQNPKLAVISIFPVIPLIVYCSFSGKTIKNYTGKCQEHKQKINGLLGVVLDLFPVIQVYRVQDLMKNTMNERLMEWQNANIRKEHTAAGLMSVSGFLSFVPLLVLLGVGGVMVIKGEITVGVFYIFINLSGNVSGFLQNMPNIYAGFKQFSAAVGRLKHKLVM